MWQFDNGNPRGTGYKWNINNDTWEKKRIADGMLNGIS
jgi:antitoxin component YwqK of YwqJK toxin-antitoxin module